MEISVVGEIITGLYVGFVTGLLWNSLEDDNGGGKLLLAVGFLVYLGAGLL